MLCLVNIEERVPPDHPLRPIKKMADEALERLSRSLDAMYSSTGRPSTGAAAQGDGADGAVRHPQRAAAARATAVQHAVSLVPGHEHGRGALRPLRLLGQPRFLEHDAAGKFFRQVVRFTKEAELMSDEHFSVDGTLMEAWASLKDLPPRADRGVAEVVTYTPRRPSLGGRQQRAEAESRTSRRITVHRPRFPTAC